MLGLSDWPPRTTLATPNDSKIRASPSPAATATTASGTRGKGCAPSPSILAGATPPVRGWAAFASDPDRLGQAAVVLLVADVLTILAGVFAVVFVRETTTRQESRASTLQPPSAATA